MPRAAGTETAYWWGNEMKSGMANCVGCGSQWDNKLTAPVGSFQPNPFGLYDTAGNVWEWVEDCDHDNYNGAPTDGSAWKKEGGGNCYMRVFRGGAWNYAAKGLRSSFRGRGDPGNRSASHRFSSCPGDRVALPAEGVQNVPVVQSVQAVPAIMRFKVPSSRFKV